jgi:hypothetical protein
VGHLARCLASHCGETLGRPLWGNNEASLMAMEREPKNTNNDDDDDGDDDYGGDDDDYDYDDIFLGEGLVEVLAIHISLCYILYTIYRALYTLLRKRLGSP